jgi:hypothetical protein
VGKCSADLDCDPGLAQADDCAEDVSEAAGCLARRVLVAQPPPQGDEGLAELGDEPVSDLAYGLRLSGELGQVVAVADRALAEAYALVLDPIVGPTISTVCGPT